MGTGEGGRRAATKLVHILAFLTIASLLPTSPALPYLLRSSFRRCVRRSLSTVCTALRERIGGFVSPVVGIHPLSAGIYTGSFMAIVSNIRYNLLQHVLEPFIEVRNGLPTARYSSAHLLARHLTPCARPQKKLTGWSMRTAIFILRAFNGFLGSYLAITGMRLVGLQRFK